MNSQTDEQWLADMRVSRAAASVGNKRMAREAREFAKSLMEDI